MKKILNLIILCSLFYSGNIYAQFSGGNTFSSPIYLGRLSADPSSNNRGGEMYYNTSLNQFRCYTTSWGDCGGGGSDVEFTDVCIVAKNGTDSSGCGSFSSPCLTWQYASTNCIGTPTTSGEYLTPKLLIIFPGSYTENVTFETRNVLSILGATRVTLTGTITYNLDNTHRFGSTLAPSLRIKSWNAGNSTASLSDFLIGNNTNSIAINESSGDPITQAIALELHGVRTSGTITDTNSNADVALRATDSTLTASPITTSPITLNSLSTLDGSNNNYGSSPTIVGTVNREVGSSLRSITVTSAPLNPGTSQGFKDCYFVLGNPVFTGPADSFVTDASTYYAFLQNGGTFAGGATAIVTEATGATSGAVFFAGPTTGAFTTDPSNLFWDNTNNRLGINTNAPGSGSNIVPLHMVATPASSVEAKAAMLVATDTNLGTGSAVVYQAFGRVSNTNYVSQFGIDISIDSSGAGYFASSAPGGIILSANNSTRHLTLNSSGNLDIGGSGAANKLVVSADGDATTPAIAMGSTADSNTGMFKPGADIWAISIAGTERVRWDSNGTTVTNIKADVFYANGIQSVTISDDASPGVRSPATVDFQKSYIEVVCNDSADGCTISTVQETGAKPGMQILIVNVGTNNFIIPDQTNIIDSRSFVTTTGLTENDSVGYIYTDGKSNDLWVETCETDL